MKKVAIIAVLVAAVAWASEPVVCTFLVTTSTRSSAYAFDAGSNINATLNCDADPADGGVRNCACPFLKGSTVMMQCTSDVYMDSTNSTATSADQFVDFTNQTDPYLIHFHAGENKVAVVSADGGARSCKFMTTLRRKPY